MSFSSNPSQQASSQLYLTPKWINQLSEQQALEKIEWELERFKEENNFHQAVTGQLKATWDHMINNNLADESLHLKRKLLAGEYPEDTCIFVTNSTASRSIKDKYPRKGLIKTKNWEGEIKPPKVGCHQLAAWIDSGLPKPGDDASHWFCDNPLCCNPKHVVWESHFANVSRATCKVYGNVKGYKCPHAKKTCRGCEPCEQ